MYDIPTYYPHTAQKKYLLRRSYCHRGMFHSQEVLDYIEEKLRATWSPEQIACTPCEPVSYTHLDVYKRQLFCIVFCIVFSMVRLLNMALCYACE